jgi:UDP-N-acetylglucosamine:LPS N-acetylglucosamine transferase
LIPLPTAADHHQERNAEEFARSGGAHVLLQDQATGEDLAKLVIQLFESPSALRSMETHIAQFFKPAAASDIVSSLISLITTPKGL